MTLPSGRIGRPRVDSTPEDAVRERIHIELNYHGWCCVRRAGNHYGGRLLVETSWPDKWWVSPVRRRYCEQHLPSRYWALYEATARILLRRSGLFVRLAL